MKKNELLAVIAQMQEQLNSLKTMVENLDNNVEEVAVNTNDTNELPVIVEDTTVVETTVVHPDFSEEMRVANTIVLNKNLIDLAPAGRSIDMIDVHLKVLPPKSEGQKPYVLWKQGIYEIDAYDINGELLCTSKQFVLDSLGTEIVMYLRQHNVGGYNKGTYEPRHCYLCCND